jgi:hypothetical protein
MYAPYSSSRVDNLCPQARALQKAVEQFGGSVHGSSFVLRWRQWTSWYYRTVRVLEHGADIEAKDIQGCTFTMYGSNSNEEVKAMDSLGFKMSVEWALRIQNESVNEWPWGKP